jgi:iron complex transport system substrate-binding protein
MAGTGPCFEMLDRYSRRHPNLPRARMPVRSRVARATVLILAILVTVSGRAAEFVDSAGRHVVLPARVERVMPAGMAAAVLIFSLAPAKLVGWNRPLSRAQRAYLPAKYARLPVVGELFRSNPAAAAAEVARWHPDLIIDSGVVTPQAAAMADRIGAQTRTPYIVLDGSIQRTPEMLRSVGMILGAGDHRLDVASYAFHAIQGLRGKLLIQSADNRPLVYYGLGSDGLTTGLADTLVTKVIDEVGAINVAARLGQGELTRVTREQIFAWNPDVVIAQQRGFYDALRHDPGWRGLSAVRDRRVFLAPNQPFGWIDDPAGVNRLVGLYWLGDLFYPNSLEEDLRGNVRDFYQSFYGVALTERQLDALVRPAAPSSVAMQNTPAVPLLGAEPTPEPELSPRGAPGTGPTLPLKPPGRGGLPAKPPEGPSNLQ